MVTLLVKVLADVPPSVSVPVTDVVPVTPSVLFPFVVRPEPVPTERLPATVLAATRVQVFVPEPEVVKFI